MARRSTRWTTSAVLCALLMAVPTLGLENDFSFYPAKAQNCLKKAGDSANCSGSTAKDLNTCLCGNGGDFITTAATCIGKEAKDVGASTYDTMQKACSTSGTPMSVSQSDFMDAVNGKDSSSSTSTSASSTSTSTSDSPSTTIATKTKTLTNSSGAPTATVTATTTPTSESNSSKDSSSSSGLSSGATIGIAVGCSLGGVAILAALGFWLFRRYRRHTDEASPMLPGPNQSTPTTFPPAEPSTAYTPYNDYKSTSSPAPTSVSPGPMSQTASWVSPSPPAFAGQHHPPPQPQAYQPYQPAPVAELASDTATSHSQAVEMPGSTHFDR